MRRGGTGQGTILLAIVASACSGSGDGGGTDGGMVATNCSADAFASALAAASPGDTVELGTCEVTGSFLVPEGVSIAGTRIGESVIVAESGSTALDIRHGASDLAIRDLTVRSNGWMGISATSEGAGRITIENVAVEFSRGIGIGVSGPSDVVLRDVEVRGSLDTAEEAEDRPAAPDMGNSPLYGLALHDVAAELEDVIVSGAASSAAVFKSSEVDWQGGEACDTFYRGVHIEGGTAAITGVAVRRTLDDLTAFNYGLVAIDGAEITTSNLTVEDNAGLGVVQLAGATGTHTDIVARRNGSTGLWVQDSAVTIVGMNGFMEANRLSGITLQNATSASISDIVVESTTLVPKIVGQETVEVGDGIHVVDSFADLAITNTTVSDNERSGIFLQATDGNVPDGIFSNVTASAGGEQLGAVAQTAEAVMTAGGTWDEGIARLDAAATNDFAHDEVLGDALSIVGMNGVVAPPSVGSLPDAP